MADKWWTKAVKTAKGDVTAYQHKATFNGIHNATKSKCLIVLENHPKLSAQELALLTGIPASSVFSSVMHWAKENWEYVQRTIDMKDGQPCFVYSIAPRGRKFLEIIPPEKMEQYKAEIAEAQQKAHAEWLSKNKPVVSEDLIKSGAVPLGSV